MADRKASPRSQGEGKPTTRKRAAKKPAAAPKPEPIEQGKPLEPLEGPDPEKPETWQDPPPDHPGFIGGETDPTPNENYSIAGVTTGKPTPETDDDTAAAARKL